MNRVGKHRVATAVNQDLRVVIMPVGSIRLEWADAEDRIDKSRDLLQREIFKRFSEDPDTAYLYLTFCNQSVSLSPSLGYLRSFCASFAKKLSHTPGSRTLRHKIDVPITDDELGQYAHARAAHDRRRVSVPGSAGTRLAGSARVLSARNQGVQGISREICARHTVRTFTLSAGSSFTSWKAKRTTFPLLFSPPTPRASRNRGSRSTCRLNMRSPNTDKTAGSSLIFLRQCSAPQKRARLSPGCLRAASCSTPSPWSAKEAYTFLKEIPLYEQSGILCRIPNWWKGGASGPRIQVTMGNAVPSAVGMDALLSFDVGLYLDDTAMSPEEARRLIESAEGLVLIKNRWVAVDPEKLKQTLEVYGKARALAKQEGISFRDALRLELNPQSMFGEIGGGGVDHGLFRTMARISHDQDAPARNSGAGKTRTVLQGKTASLSGARRGMALVSRFVQVRHVSCRRYGARQDRAGPGPAAQPEKQQRERREPARGRPRRFWRTGKARSCDSRRISRSISSLIHPAKRQGAFNRKTRGSLTALIWSSQPIPIVRVLHGSTPTNGNM